MGTSKNALFPQWRRHRFLLLQNRHTIHPVHKHRTRILMYYSYTAVLRAMVTRALPSPFGPAYGCCLRFASAPRPYEKITIFRGTQMGGNLDL